MKIERVNDKLEALVNKGIATILMTGMREGIKVMNHNQVPIQIIARVVISPKFRRSTDWRH